MGVTECADAIDREVDVLLASLAGSVPSDIVRDVVLAVRRDLDGQVPAEALPEFLHRSCVQRLVAQQGSTAARHVFLPRTAGD